MAGYVAELIKETLQRVGGTPWSPLHLQWNETPPQLCSSYTKPEKKEAVANHKSRFAK